MHPKEERTLLIVKPDGVKRGIIGDAIHRMERRGLKVVALKMIWVDKEKAKGFYPGTDEWLIGMGNKTLGNYKQYGKDPVKEMGTDDPLEIGKYVYDWLSDFISSGPIVPMVIKGVHAVDAVRKTVGATLPSMADMGTIRGDYSVDSPTAANADKRAIKNVVHATGSLEETEQEIAYWFTEGEIHDYKRAEEDIMF